MRICGMSSVIAKATTRYCSTFSWRSARHPRTTRHIVACASIQLDPNRSSAYARASAGRMIWRFRSLAGNVESDPFEAATKLATSVEIVSKFDVSETVPSDWMGKVVLSTVDTARIEVVSRYLSNG